MVAAAQEILSVAELFIDTAEISDAAANSIQGRLLAQGH
jgi:hypothetical protein